MSEFETARRETIRYHEAFYASSGLGQAGTWLAKPHRLLGEALGQVRRENPVVAYDLGAGIGRHTIPMLEQLPPESTVYAVDLLASALDQLWTAVPTDVHTKLRTRLVDLVDFEFEEPADLVLAFSALEHLPNVAAIQVLLGRIERATKPGGVVAIGIIADRIEIDADGSHRPGLLESAISSAQAMRLFEATFNDFEIIDQRLSAASVTERRDGEEYTLASTLVSLLAVKQ